MRVLMLADIPPALITHSDSGSIWDRYFLPTPVLNLLEGMSKVPELEIFVLSFRRDGEGRRTLWERVHVEIIQVPKGMGLATLYLPRSYILLKMVKRIRPDIVHGQGIEAGYAWLATLQPYPHVLTFHGVYGVTAYLKLQGIWQRLGYFLQWVTLKKAKNIIAISHYLEQWFRKVSKANVYYIPNAIHDRFYQIIPAEKAEFDLLYVGRITPAKGLLDAIETVVRLEKTVKHKIRIAVVGRPSDIGGEDYLKRCHQRAEALERSEVVFLGSLPYEKLPDILSLSKLLVLPSYGESFSMAAAEASAAGVPVVAYRVGGLPSVVRDGETGFLVPPGDLDSLSKAIGELIENEKLRRQFSQAAKEYALRWHQDTVALQTVELYYKISQKNTS